MRKACFVLIPLFVMVLAMTGLAVADDKKDAEELVNKGLEYYKVNGEDKALEEFSNTKGQFVKGELYLFVVDFNGLTTSHGGNPALIGKNMKDLKDADGKLFIQEMMDSAKKGGGWIDYKWKNPKTGEVMPKSSYVQKIGDNSFIGCGIYKK